MQLTSPTPPRRSKARRWAAVSARGRGRRPSGGSVPRDHTTTAWRMGRPMEGLCSELVGRSRRTGGQGVRWRMTPSAMSPPPSVLDPLGRRSCDIELPACALFDHTARAVGRGGDLGGCASGYAALCVDYGCYRVGRKPQEARSHAVCTPPRPQGISGQLGRVGTGLGLRVRRSRGSRSGHGRRSLGRCDPHTQ